MNLEYRKRKEKIFRNLCRSLSWMMVVVLATLLIYIAQQGVSWLNWKFLTSFPSRFPEKSGILAPIVGTLWLMGLTAMIAIPVGVAAAIHLEEFSHQKGRFARLLEANIANLAGVPSVIYGLLGLTVFVRHLSLGRSVLAGALTLSLLILPVIIITSREAIRAVPASIRQAGFGVGATRWQTTIGLVLPAAFSGILTSVILSLSRAIGETAPLIIVGALTYVAFVPETPLDSFTALPIQIFNWAARPQEEFKNIAAAAILVLMVTLIGMNSIATLLRHRAQKRRPW